MPCAESPSAMAFTSSGCSLQNSAIWSNDSAVLSSSQTAVAFGINGAAATWHVSWQRSLGFARPWRAKHQIIGDDREKWPEYRDMGLFVQPLRLDRRGGSHPMSGAFADGISRMAAETAQKPPLKVLLCSPRGFCAGVVRAIDSVERRSRSMGRRSMSATKSCTTAIVVEGLRAKGAIFVEELREIPETPARR